MREYSISIFISLWVFAHKNEVTGHVDRHFAKALSAFFRLYLWVCIWMSALVLGNQERTLFGIAVVFWKNALIFSIPALSTKWCILPFLTDVSSLTCWTVTPGRCDIPASSSSSKMSNVCFCVNHHITMSLFLRISVKRCVYYCPSYSAIVLKPYV